MLMQPPTAEPRLCRCGIGYRRESPHQSYRRIGWTEHRRSKGRPQERGRPWSCCDGLRSFYHILVAINPCFRTPKTASRFSSGPNRSPSPLCLRTSATLRSRPGTQ
jgi:hypothetical protein